MERKLALLHETALPFGARSSVLSFNSVSRQLLSSLSMAFASSRRFMSTITPRLLWSLKQPRFLPASTRCAVSQAVISRSPSLLLSRSTRLELFIGAVSARARLRLQTPFIGRLEELSTAVVSILTAGKLEPPQGARSEVDSLSPPYRCDCFAKLGQSARQAGHFAIHNAQRPLIRSAVRDLAPIVVARRVGWWSTLWSSLFGRAGRRRSSSASSHCPLSSRPWR